MRYFKLMVCTGILLLLSGAASGQQDYISIFAGGGPNNVPATSAPVFNEPASVALDGAGNVYFTTGGNNYPWDVVENRVWKVTKSTGILTILAGSYYEGYSGDGGPAVDAQFQNPTGIAVDSAGNVFIADTNNEIVREVNVSTGIINTIAGTPGRSGYSIDNRPATIALLYFPRGVAIDKNGNLFIADTNNHRIRMVACATVTSSGGTCTPNAGQTTGYIYTVAGTGNYPYSGDNTPATSANLYHPYGVTTDNAGNLYIADTFDSLVRRVACGTGISGCTPPPDETSGYIYTLAGYGESPGHSGTAGYNGDGIEANTAELNIPISVSVDNSGNLFIADNNNNRTREVSCVTTTSNGGTCTPNSAQASGNIYTVAGTGTAGYNGDNQAATTAELNYPDWVAVDGAGDLFIADGNDLVREVTCDNYMVACTPPPGADWGYIYTIAGTPSSPSPSFSGNDVPANDATLFSPTGTASDSAGNLYIADTGNCVVREVSASTGNISTFAGIPGICSYGGDGGSATSAYLNDPYKVAVDSLDNVYIADELNCVVRKVSGGTISTFAGTPGTCGYGGDGGAATSAQLYWPTGVAVDNSGNVYIADQHNQVVRNVSGGIISTFAGNYALGGGFSGDFGPATSAQLATPIDVAVDRTGNVYIADEVNSRIRKVNPSGIITTYAGNGTTGYLGDGILAITTSLYYPEGVAVDLAGDVLIADNDNGRVRLVDQGGIIHTIAGNGTGAGFYGNDVLATTAALQPVSVSIDPSGNIYAADVNTYLIRKISALAIVNPSLVSVTFDQQPIKTTSEPVAITLAANGSVDIGSITLSAGFVETDDCPSTLNSTTCTIDVSFAPTVAGIINGTLTISYNGFFTQETVVNLQGTATALTLSPTSLAFGSHLVATSTTKTVTVKGGTTYTATSATLEGDTTDFTIASNTCTGAITTRCVIGVKFDPLSTGAKKATLIIHDSDPTNPQLVGLTGTGTSSESFTPASVTFTKDQTINVASTNTKVTFKYTGTGTLTLTSLVASTNYSINYTGITSGGCNTVTSLATNATCTFNVAFTPTSIGTITGTVTANFTGDPNGFTSQQLPLSGTGTEVTLSPASLAFGTVTTIKTLSVTVKNMGATPLTFSSAPTITGTGAANFAVLPYNTPSTSTCLNGTVTLAQYGFCTYTVTFTGGVGTTSLAADLNISDNGGGSPQVVAMTGTETEVSLTPATLAFGTILGTETLSMAVQNLGTTPLTFSKAPTVTGTGAANFVVQPYIVGTQSTCLEPGLTLTQDQICTYTVTFTNAGGTTSFTTSLNIFDNGGGSPQLEKMTARD